jgi:hypothetical protein
MSKNINNKINAYNSDKKLNDFNKAKEVLFSVKNREQLISAVKYINNFNKKYGITENSAEFKFFEKIIEVVKLKLRSRKAFINEPIDEEDNHLGFNQSLGDFDWVKDIESNFKPNLPFDGKEYWLDLTNVDIEGIKKIVDYIKIVLPNYFDREGNGFNIAEKGRYKGIIIHCATDDEDYTPRENTICFSMLTYQEDQKDTYWEVPHYYLDGKEILYYIEMLDAEEDLDESLEWSSKDNYFDEKDKNFENDSSWTGDDEWSPNPDRSYWKQGDINESDDFDWIRDFSDQLPTYDQRSRVDLKDFLLDYAEDNLSVIDFIYDEDLYIPTDDYKRRYTPEEWDEHGMDQWRDGDFKQHGQWVDNPWVTSWDLIEELESDCSKWEFIDRVTEDYDLSSGRYNDLFIFKRKKDGRYFALGVDGDSYDGMTDNNDFLYEVFPRMKLVYESRKNLIKKILNENDFSWIYDVRVHGNYNGHPQGIVKIYDHDEINRLVDVIDIYNGFKSFSTRNDLHNALEARRDELEEMSENDDFDYGEAMLSVTFFVEKEPHGYGRNALTIGYWSYEVDERDIRDWLDYDYTYNRDYENYDSIEQVEDLFKNYPRSTEN